LDRPDTSDGGTLIHIELHTRTNYDGDRPRLAGNGARFLGTPRNLESADVALLAEPWWNSVRFEVDRRV